MRVLIVSMLFRCFLQRVSSQSVFECKNCDQGKELCIENGQPCTTCVDGYWGGKCKENCPSQCIACEENPVRSGPWPAPILYYICTKCVEGRYLGDTNVTKDCSLTCPLSCSTCTSSINCGLCKNGYYGQVCDQVCSDGCGKCNKENGHCAECTFSYLTGLFCESCVDGTFGSMCNRSCPTNCKDDVCERYSGYCFSCKENFSGLKCTECVPGKYGLDCTQMCSANCKNKECLQENGICVNCFEGFTGPHCDQCSAGLYSQNCSLPCLSANCFNNTCNRNSGLCEYDGLCANGWYGEFCNEICSDGCKDKDCLKQNGVCLDGCLDNLSGDKCCVSGANCLLCSTKSDCATCVTGYYGTSCQFSCSDNCSGGCSKDSGQCNSCLVNTYGLFCTDICPDTCRDNGNSTDCDVNNGRCLIVCNEGFYGGMCKDKCISTCFDKTCDRCLGVCIAAEETSMSGELVKKLAIAVVVTFVFAVLITLVVQRLARLVRGRRGKDRKEDLQARELSANPYETLGNDQANLQTHYVTIQNTTSDYANTLGFR